METKQRIIIPECDWHERNPKQEEDFMLLSRLKKEKRFDEAFALIDVIESEATEYLRKFISYSRVNKERSILYRKLKNKPNTQYYNLLYEMFVMINGTYFGQNLDLVKLYCGKEFSYYGEAIDKQVREYAKWFKPLALRLMSVHKEIERELEDAHSKYQYTNSGNMEMYLYRNNAEFNAITKLIESNMPHVFFNKSLFEAIR